jgi:hypothetical protein
MGNATILHILQETRIRDRLDRARTGTEAVENTQQNNGNNNPQDDVFSKIVQKWSSLHQGDVP